MKPGELVEYSRATKISTIKQVNPAVYSSWKHYELIFDNTPVREIIQILEDTYGLQIQLKSKNLLNKKYTGTFKGADSDIILESLATLFGLEIDQTKDIIIIKDKE
jgi:ferric-dicitrate binding protein FerR (iron transport regulator)